LNAHTQKALNEGLKMNTKNIRLLEGDEVLQLLENTEFFEKLNTLYQESTGITIFQSPGFIKSWYLIKNPEFAPIMVINETSSKLEGAVFLAVKKEDDGQIKRKNSKIVGLGEYDAEYQTWLVKEGEEKAFLPGAFDQIFNAYPNCKVVFRFIPHAKSLAWIKENPIYDKFSVVQPFRRPMMQMSHPDFKPLFKKRHLKAKLNRFGRAGKMEFEEITEIERFIEVYDEVMVLYDFRQGALFNKTPSVSNPLRRPLFISLFEQNLLHVSILKLDGEITSCIIGMKSKNWMHLSGLVTYSPFYSKHSPGLVHLYLLGQYLEDQGYEYFDLSPGDDGYKERLATNADEVYELSVCRDRVFKSKRKLRKKFHAWLLSKGIRPMSFNVQVQRSKHLIKVKLGALKKRFLPPKGNQRDHVSAPVQLEKNNIRHLLAFEDKLGISRWEFLSDAFKRVESGEEFYSWKDGTRLLACVWICDAATSNNEGAGLGNTETAAYFHPTVLFRKEEIIKLALPKHLIPNQNCNPIK
jgi:hypothetical protein